MVNSWESVEWLPLYTVHSTLIPTPLSYLFAFSFQLLREFGLTIHLTVIFNQINSQCILNSCTTVVVVVVGQFDLMLAVKLKCLTASFIIETRKRETWGESGTDKAYLRVV